MITYILIVSLLVTHSISKYFCDRIKFKGNFKSDWMIGAGKYMWNKRTWLMKYPLSFISDGWHFFDAVRVMCFCIALALLGEFGVYMAVIFYIIHGLIFETLYKIK